MVGLSEGFPVSTRLPVLSPREGTLKGWTDLSQMEPSDDALAGGARRFAYFRCVVRDRVTACFCGAAQA
jgi:hypothetical protein